MAGIADKLGKLFGPQSMVRQFFVWGLLSEIAGAALAPFFTSIRNHAQSVNPNVALTPGELADLVVRGHVAEDWATNEAKKSGIHPNLFALLVKNTGEPPSLIDMLQLLRRGQTDRDAVIRAIHQSRVKSEWVDTILKLGIQYPSPTEILRALLQGQVNFERAHELYTQLGGAPEYFQLLYDTEGSAPTPNEAAEMAHKGIIPWDGEGAGTVSFRQAFLEGPWRNKWFEPWKRMSEYLPPPRTITAMLREGSLTVEKAADLLKRQGVPPELIPVYLTDASATKTGKTKELTESTIAKLYGEHAISDDDAHGYLLKLRYTPVEADFVLSSWKLAREMKYRDTAIGTVHSQFINHKIDNLVASQLLDEFAVPATQRDALIRLWIQERKAKVAMLTPAQIKTAAKKDLMSPDDAIQRLVNLGYSEADAQIFLVI